MEVSTVLAWGAVSSAGLVAGAAAGLYARPSHRTIAVTMSVSAGLLLAAATLELAAEAIRAIGARPAILALLLGAAVMSGADVLLARFGAANRKRCGECTPQPSEAQQPGSGVAIALGTALDAVPETLVLGLVMREGGVPAELLIAISVGNFPEAFSATAGMRLAGRSQRYVVVVWSAIALGGALLTVVGYVAFGASSMPHLQAFGAGAILVMTAETIIPEAFHNSPRFSGFVAAVGFCGVLLVEAASG